VPRKTNITIPRGLRVWQVADKYNLKILYGIRFFIYREDDKPFRLGIRVPGSVDNKILKGINFQKISNGQHHYDVLVQYEYFENVIDNLCNEGVVQLSAQSFFITNPKKFRLKIVDSQYGIHKKLYDQNGIQWISQFYGLPDIKRIKINQTI